MVNYAPLVEVTSDKADYEKFDRRVAQSFSKITNRSCDRLVDFLAYPKEKGGLGLLMPGFYHDELRRVWASLDVNKGTRDPVELSVDGQALQGKGPTSTASSRAHTSFRTERRRAVCRCAAC